MESERKETGRKKKRTGIEVEIEDGEAKVKVETWRQ